MNPALTSDIQARFYRPLTDHEVDISQHLLDDAWDLLVSRRSTLEADMTAGTVKTGNVVRVLVAMVGRVLSNPEGKLEEALDDYRYRRDSIVSGGLLHVTSEELADVTPYRRRRRSVRLIAYGEE
jgi:hypothetical protein